MIYDNQPCGDTPLRIFAVWYYLNSSMARAARQRLSGVVNWITTRSEQIIKEKGEIHILSLACGGARDAILALSNKDWRHQVSFLGIDADEQALIHARQFCIAHGLPHFQFRKGNALRPRLYNKDNFDLVLCVGLFDYYDDKTARLIMNRIHKHMEHGALFLFGMTGKNPSKDFFEKRLNWHLRYRIGKEIMSFAQTTAFSSPILVKNCNDCFILIECKK